VQAGAQPDDVLDGSVPCVLPNPGDPKDPFVIKDAVSGVDPLDRSTWRSLNCSYARLSQIVGLNRVVDTTYRLAHSPYLYPGQPREDREPLHPYASFATGANELSPLDMASGAQSIANNGVHHDPYFVEHIERADGRRIYTHDDPGVQVLDLSAALMTTSILKGVLTQGTARHVLADFPFPAAGKTGTQQDNTNSWFVGYTPHLTTAVWVGDPDGYTPMNRQFTPEFYGPGMLTSEGGVQGGTFPARIWNAFMTPALYGLATEDWPAPAAPARPAMRLYLPGVECPSAAPQPSAPQPPSTPTVPATSAAPQVTPPAGADADDAGAAQNAAGLRAHGFGASRKEPSAAPAAPVPTDPAPQPQPEPEPDPPAGDEPAGTDTPATDPAPAGDRGPTQTAAPRPKPSPGTVVVQPRPTDTTIPPSVLDPRAPLPMTDLRVRINRCSTAPTAPAR
jgi:penicillin-binding protein 1A